MKSKDPVCFSFLHQSQWMGSQQGGARAPICHPCGALTKWHPVGHGLSHPPQIAESTEDGVRPVRHFKDCPCWTDVWSWLSVSLYFDNFLKLNETPKSHRLSVSSWIVFWSWCKNLWKLMTNSESKTNKKCLQFPWGTFDCRFNRLLSKIPPLRWNDFFGQTLTP